MTNEEVLKRVKENLKQEIQAYKNYLRLYDWDQGLQPYNFVDFLRLYSPLTYPIPKTYSKKPCQNQTN